MCLCGCEVVYQDKGYCYINLAPIFKIYRYQYTNNKRKTSLKMSHDHSDKIN